MKRVFRLVLLGLVLALTAHGQQTQPQQPDMPGQPATQEVARPGGNLPGNVSLELVRVADGLIDPVNVASAGDGSGRLFIVERVGFIRILDEDNNLREEPFIDLSALVKTDFLEMGLLGLAFHPNYSENGFFYVYFNHYSTNGTSFVVEYQVSEDNYDQANPDSARVVLTVPQPFINHNGGTIKFGPDGYLYIALGDGGSAGDPYETAQNINDLLGSLLRIDVDDHGSNHSYGIPEDNPFARAGVLQVRPQGGAQGLYYPAARPEIWAYGLRNPWQFSFDPQTGDLYIADVGQGEWEEVNFQAADTGGGQNYGWDIMEGAHCFPADADCGGNFGVLPVAEYDHSQGDCSITGIGVYRGSESPSLDGVYFNSDYCSGRFWGLARDEGGSWVYQELLDTDLLVTGAGSDEDGELYVTTCLCTFGRAYENISPPFSPNGSVWRLVVSENVPEGAETATVETADAFAEAEEEEEQEQTEGEGGASTATVSIGESEEYGAYLTDAEGRTLYLFINEEVEAQGDERMTSGVRSNAAPCTEGCLTSWPPLTGETFEAGEGVDAELLYTEDVDGRMQVVYNGWPLYYFARDEEPGRLEGQGRGSAPTIWYIVSPEGQPIHGEDQDQENEGQNQTQTAQALDEQGQQVYAQVCAACHGANGEGGVGPALAGNQNLRDANHVADMILHGGNGMPAFGGQLSDEQVAAVATHERTSWGNDFGAVTVEEVQARR
jgi:glucose/arabinose dehydrogenase/mono/diheme cytochrome c family protein